MKTRISDIQQMFKNTKARDIGNDSVDTRKIPYAYIVKLTEACNLSCKYCYVDSDEDRQRLNFDDALYIVKKIDDSVERPIALYLHGGEPCLRPDIIEAIGEAIQAGIYKNQITLLMQTNGTLINDRIIDMVKKYNINVGVSIDGITPNANQLRPYKNGDSLNLTLKGIHRLLEDNIEIGIYSVITNKNIDCLVDTISYFADLGVRDFVTGPYVLWGSAHNMRGWMVTDDELFSYYVNLIDWIITHNNGKEPSQRVHERNLHFWYRSMFFGERGYMCASMSPCGAGRATVGVGCEGNVYFCDQFYGDKKFLLGNMLQHERIDDLFDNAKDKIESLTRRIAVVSSSMCKQFRERQTNRVSAGRVYHELRPNWGSESTISQ